MASLSVLFVQNRLCSRTWKQAGALVEGGHAVSIFELGNPSRFRDYSAFKEHASVQVPPDLRSIVRHQRRIRKALGEHIAARTYDIIHSANAPDAFGAWLPGLSDVPVVHDVHDIQTVMRTSWSNAFYNPVVDLLKRHWEKRACTRADGLLTTSPFMADYFARKYGVSRVWALENKPFPTTIDPLPKRSDEDGEVHLVYAGGITLEEKSDRRLIPPFLRLADLGYHIHVYGIFAADDRPAIEAAFATHPRMHLEPLVPQQSFIEEMSQFDAGLIWFTSMHDNIRSASPNKLYEFQVAGIPVITNVQEGALPEEVRRRRCGYVVKDPDDLHKTFQRDRRFTFDLADCFLTSADLEKVYQVVLGADGS